MKTRNKSVRKGIGFKTYAIVVDGETEMWYLQMLKRNEPKCTITVKPELPKKKTLEDQCRSVKENAENYDKSIWVLDLDTIVKENRENSQSRDNVIENLKKIFDEVAGNDKIHILINNPCLEFWFLLHVKETGKYYPECNPLNQELKKNVALKDYEKTGKYFTNTGNDIYKRLKPYQTIGYKNAKRLGDFDIENPQQAKSEMFKIIDLLELNNLIKT